MFFEPECENAESVRLTGASILTIHKGMDIFQAMAIALSKVLGIAFTYACRDVNSLQQPLVCQ